MSEIIRGFPFEFYGETYVACLASDRQFYIRLEDVCTGLGVDARGQRRRILLVYRCDILPPEIISEAHARSQQEFKDRFHVHIYTALKETQLHEAIDLLAGR